MKYFFDTEFIEGKQDIKFLGFRIGESKPTIDLISIGIVAEDGRKYYAISKDFNLRKAWDDAWIQENVLLPIYIENVHGDYRNKINFTYSGMKHVLEMVGKSNKTIAKEIKEFTYNQTDYQKYNGTYTSKPEFWAYYADYDWVVFCQLFGRMIDLPTGFPMYCKDLKQSLDEFAFNEQLSVEEVKNLPEYPKQENEHNALADADWNRELYYFLY